MGILIFMHYYYKNLIRIGNAESYPALIDGPVYNTTQCIDMQCVINGVYVKELPSR